MGTNPTARITGREVNGAKAVAAALGICVGVSGLDHGFFEALQGNTPTPGLIVQAIGPAQRMWIYGTEEAFTLIPNFLLTGFLAMLVGLATIIWSVRSIDRPYGSRIFVLLGGLMFMVGGGIGMLVFLLVGWLVARRIHRPLAWVASACREPCAGSSRGRGRGLSPSAWRCMPSPSRSRSSASFLGCPIRIRRLSICWLRPAGQCSPPWALRSSAPPLGTFTGTAVQHQVGAPVAGFGMTRRRREQPLTRDELLDAALGIVDSEGLAALTMRRLAAAVGVEAMSLYYHVPQQGGAPRRGRRADALGDAAPRDRAR